MNLEHLFVTTYYTNWEGDTVVGIVTTAEEAQRWLKAPRLPGCCDDGHHVTHFQLVDGNYVNRGDLCRVIPKEEKR